MVRGFAESKYDNLDCVKLIKWEEPVSSGVINFCGIEYQKQLVCGMTGFWHHQFVKAKVLRQVFVDGDEYNNDIRLLNNRLHQQFNLDFLSTVYVPTSSVVWFKEPLKKGLLTTNGIDDLRKFNCPIPEYDVIHHDIYFKPINER